MLGLFIKDFIVKIFVDYVVIVTLFMLSFQII